MIPMLLFFPYDAPICALAIGLVAWWRHRKNPTVRRLEWLVRLDRRLQREQHTVGLKPKRDRRVGP